MCLSLNIFMILMPFGLTLISLKLMMLVSLSLQFPKSWSNMTVGGVTVVLAALL